MDTRSETDHPAHRTDWEVRWDGTFSSGQTLAAERRMAAKRSNETLFALTDLSR
jgi:hypothetical protein